MSSPTASSFSSSSSRKRKRPSASKKTPDSSNPVVPEEKRAARYRAYATDDIQKRIVRALNQRLYLINQEDKSSSSTSLPLPSLAKHFAVLGSTGNVYNVIIDKKPACTCPDFNRGHLCKHILFVILKVLRVPPDSPLVFQKALLQSELQQIFSNAPQQATAAVSAKECVTEAYLQKVLGEKVKETKKTPEDEEEKSEHLPPLEGECAVCFDAMLSPAEVVACPTCKNNLHKECLQQWLKHSLTCVYCRASLSRTIASPGSAYANEIGRDNGYVNLGDMQGLSRVRDNSSYSYSRFHHR